MQKQPTRPYELASLCVFVLVLGVIGCYFLNKMRDDVRSVKTHWSGDTLVVRNITGRILITNLMVGSSGATTTLPKPVFIIDSEGATFSHEQMKKLEWRGEDKQVMPPPAVGTPITILFVRLEGSELSKTTPTP
jgi:hypothetical protein